MFGCKLNLDDTVGSVLDKARFDKAIPYQKFQFLCFCDALERKARHKLRTEAGIALGRLLCLFTASGLTFRLHPAE